jgi:hypothetical protein
MSLGELGSDCVWQFQQLDRNMKIADEIVEEFHQVCVSGFGSESQEWTPNIKLKLSQSTILGRLVNPQEKVCGIAFYSAPDLLFDGTHFLWEDGICIVKELQGNGYSWAAIEQVAKIFPERTFRWVGCRTQNPAMFLRYAKLGKAFPFDELYNTPSGKRLMSFLIENFVEVQEVDVSTQLNRDNGIFSAIYPQGKLGDYRTELGGTDAFEKQLGQWGFQRNRGDAVLIVSCLRKSL